jgi:hypothetical protein
VPLFGGVDRIWELAGARVAFGLVYLLVLLALREFSRRDCRFFLERAHPGKMVSYVREEVRGRTLR